MGTKLTSPGIIQVIALTVITAAFTSMANAQNLGVASNQVTISIPGSSFSTTATLSAPGNVSAVTGIPAQSTGNLTVPKFTFTLEQDGSANSTSGTYAAGIIIDEDSSQRRLEVFIPGISLSFGAGGALTGTLTTPTVNIYGRDGSGAVLASTSVASAGSVSFSGSSLSFSAADQISLVQAQGGILADILTSINNTGLSYTYTVVLAPTAGTVYSFGLDATGAFSAFQNAGVAEFNIGGDPKNGTDATTLSSGQKLTGSLSFAASGGGGGGGGGGSSTSANDTSINNAQDGLQADLDAAGAPGNELINSINDAATDAADKVAAGTASPSVLFGVLDTLNKSIDKQDATTSVADTAATLASITKVVKALQGVTLTTEQKQDFLTKIVTTLSNTAANFEERGATQIRDVRSILDNLGESLSQAATVLNDGVVPNNLASAAILASTAVIGTKIYFSSAGYRYSRVHLSHAKLLLGASSGISAIATSAGPESTQAVTNNLGALNGEDTKVEISDGVIRTATDTLLAVINADGATAQFDSATSVTEVRAGDQFVPTYLVETAIIGEHIPEGFLNAGDGSLIAIKDGIGATYVPAPRDVTGLIATLEASDIDITIEPDGSLYLVSGSGEKLSATFAFEDLDTGVLGANSVSFTLPTGNPKDPGYRIQVTYSDGTVQSLLPYVEADDFYDSLLNQDVEVATDRATGIITGPDGIRLRPDYFVQPVTASDLQFHADNEDSYGIAYRVNDVDGDGVSDVEVITADGKQTLYGLN